jgi:hypothetical protein
MVCVQPISAQSDYFIWSGRSCVSGQAVCLSHGILLKSAETGIRTSTLLITRPVLYHYATESGVSACHTLSLILCGLSSETLYSDHAF